MIGLTINVRREVPGGSIANFRRTWPSHRVRAVQAVADRLERGIRLASVSEFATHPTGALARSWVRDPVVNRGNAVSVKVRSPLVYAKIQHYGGTILPRTVTRLAIPLLDHLRKQGLWPRDFEPGKFYATSPPGRNGALIDRETGQPWYLLRTSVTLPGTRYVTKGAADARRYIREVVRAAIRSAAMDTAAAGGAA